VGLVADDRGFGELVICVGTELNATTSCYEHMRGVRSTEYRCSYANVKVVGPISKDFRVVVRCIAHPIETYILLETVLRARRPLTALELAYVLTLGLDKISRELDEQRSLQSRLNHKDISLTGENAWSFLERIHCSCEGLLQVYGRYSDNPWLDENEWV
jgi:hypothetical protein